MDAHGVQLRLVRLADVVRWYMRARNVHFVPAAMAVHDKLAAEPDLDLFLAMPTGLARAVTAKHTFGLGWGPKPRIRSYGIDGGPAPQRQRIPLPDGVEPGVSAALYFVRSAWGGGRYDETCLDSPSWDGTWLAVRCKLAAELWGGLPTGRPMTWAELCAVRRADKEAVRKPYWTYEQWAALGNEDMKRKGQPGARMQMGMELGITAARISQILTERGEGQGAAASAQKVHRIRAVGGK